MTNDEFTSNIAQLIKQMPLELMTFNEVSEKRGALLYHGPIPDVSMFNEWVEKALWMLETSAVATRNMPSGKFVALAYKNGYVVVSNDLKDSLSEEMYSACNVATYSDFGIERKLTCLVFTQIPFEMRIVFNGDTCMVFLVGNHAADVVVYSQERLRQIVVN